MFAFTGKIILEPIYKKIEIHAEHECFENGKQWASALINDYIIATDFDGRQFRFTHHGGLEEINRPNDL